MSLSVPQTQIAVPYLDAVDRDYHLIEAARPVIERLGEHLADSSHATVGG